MRVAIFSSDSAAAARLEADFAALSRARLSTFTDLSQAAAWAEAQSAAAVVLAADGDPDAFLNGIVSLRKRFPADCATLLALVPSGGTVTMAAALSAGATEVARLDAHPAELRNRLAVLLDLVDARAALREEREAARRLSIVDPLTGLMNRPAFMQRLDAEIARARRSGGGMAAAILDIDRLKEINERHGFAIGDRVLTACADQCREILRDMDLAGRLGGTEFGLCLPGAGVGDGAVVLDRLRRRIAGLAFPLPRDSLSVTISIGVTALDSDDQDASDTINRADRALLKAKDLGRDRVETA